MSNCYYEDDELFRFSFTDTDMQNASFHVRGEMKQSGSRGNPLKLNYLYHQIGGKDAHNEHQSYLWYPENFSWGSLGARGLICPAIRRNKIDRPEE